MSVELKGKARRHLRKAIADDLNARAPLPQFDYAARCRPGKGKAKLWGIGVAGGLYLLGFSGGYYGFSSGVVEPEAFAKLVWILMIPTSVFGAFTWMINHSRFEYAVRTALREDIGRLEAGDGWLWRYGPLLDKTTIKGVDIGAAVGLSRARHGADIDPQDYAAVIAALHQLLSETGTSTLTADAIQRTAAQLGLE